MLGAGAGTRLAPLTALEPKPLLRLAGRPIIAHAFDKLAEAGLEEVVAVVGPWPAQALAELPRVAPSSLRLHLVEQPAPLGIADALRRVGRVARGRPILVLLGDLVFEASVRPFLERARREPGTWLATTTVAEPSRYGVVEVEGDDRVVRLVEKPAEPRSNRVAAGIYAVTDEIFPAIERIRPSPRGELELTDALQVLVESGQPVRAFPLDGWWLDAGTPGGLLAAHERVLAGLVADIRGDVLGCDLRGPVAVSAEARCRASRITGPAWIGPGASVEHCQIGPFVSIGAGVVARRSRIAYSIVWDGARVETSGQWIVQSLIGRQSRIELGRGSWRIVAGPQSQLMTQSIARPRQSPP